MPSRFLFYRRKVKWWLRLTKLERAVEPAFVAVRGPTREGNFARYALADKRLYQLCELMCMRIEDDARQRAKELAR